MNYVIKKGKKRAVIAVLVLHF